MHQLEMTVTFNASVERLYESWHKPEILMKWFAPGEMCVAQAMSSFQEGGAYRIIMRENDGTEHIVSGKYLQIAENEKLCFSWQWQDSPHTTHVDLTFKSIDESTSELLLVHSEFPDQDMCDRHQKGWIGCIERLSLLQL